MDHPECIEGDQEFRLTGKEIMQFSILFHLKKNPSYGGAIEWEIDKREFRGKG